MAKKETNDDRSHRGPQDRAGIGHGPDPRTRKSGSRAAQLSRGEHRDDGKPHMGTQQGAAESRDPFVDVVNAEDTGD